MSEIRTAIIGIALGLVFGGLFIWTIVAIRHIVSVFPANETVQIDAGTDAAYNCFICATHSDSPTEKSLDY
jgi:hypothetical protein